MFILKAPGVRRGYRRPAPVELVDAAPTLAFVSGIPVPRQAEGRIRHDLLEEELFLAQGRAACRRSVLYLSDVLRASPATRGPGWARRTTGSERG
jgi:hypothetical protein